MNARLYLDNAATSFPKPREVTQAMVRYATEVGASAGRGAYAEARESARIIRLCRERLNTLFNGQNPDHFIFTLNCSDALNLAIKGMVRPGDHVINTAMDHNSILRQLNALVADGVITNSRMPVSAGNCVVDPDDIRRAITPKTKLIASIHGSNVTGTLQPIREIGKIAREHGIPFLVDAAQTAGHYPLDIEADNIDLLAFPGHKGLMGPLGTGALYIRPGLEKQLRPLRHGGTGSVSEHDTQPEFMPDKYESGSHNGIGIAGLSEGLAWILNKTIDALWVHDRALTKTFMEEVEGLEGFQYFGPQGIKDRMGIFSVRVRDLTPATLAHRLESEYGLLTRPGLHCAPGAHQAIGTTQFGGTTRLSFGAFLEPTEIRYAADALATIALEAYKSPMPV